MTPYSRQKIFNEDIQEVNKVLKSDYLTQGPFVDRFESSIIKYTGAKFATAVNSATSALHLSCLALGLKKGENSIQNILCYAPLKSVIIVLPHYFRYMPKQVKRSLERF